MSFLRSNHTLEDALTAVKRVGPTPTGGTDGPTALEFPMAGVIGAVLCLSLLVVLVILAAKYPEAVTRVRHLLLALAVLMASICNSGGQGVPPPSPSNGGPRAPGIELADLPDRPRPVGQSAHSQWI